MSGPEKLKIDASKDKKSGQVSAFLMAGKTRLPVCLGYPEQGLVAAAAPAAPLAATISSLTTTAATLTAATAMRLATSTAKTAATGFFRTLPGLIYFQGSPFQHLTIHLCDCRFCFSIVRYFNKSETI